MSEQELDELLDRIRGAVSGGAVSEEDYKKLEAIAGSLVYVTRLVEDEGMTLRQLRSLILRKKSEKTRKVLERAGLAEGSSTAGGSEPPSESAPASADPTAASTDDKKPKAKGHGRNGASAYRRAERIAIPHGQLESGASCPKCPKGKVYAKKHASQLVRIVGQAPLQAKVYELERLRCNLCGEVFTAEPPAGVGDEKYDPSAKAMIGLLKYGTGLPFYRLDGLQASLGVPLPDTTQWDVVSGAATSLRVVYDELVRQAAQGEVLYNDDTSMRILALMKENQARLRAAGGKSEKVRTGIFTSGIVATTDGDKIALFFTGRQHAGENLTDVLKKREAEREPPIQMCDASSRNLPQELEVIVANCIVHGRRHFVDVIENFPEECRHVLEALAEVYGVEATARKEKLDPQARLELHQRSSRPVMDELHGWLKEQLDDKRVEPNSGLGKATKYMLRHWEKLTLFLRKPGAPLDSNVVERSLKKVILHRKNALFYKTENGAFVGDIFMSFIHTCELRKVDPLDYLTELLRHPDDLALQPEAWLPWTYRDTLATMSGEEADPDQGLDRGG